MTLLNVHKKWLDWLNFFILVGGPLEGLIDSMIILPQFIVAIKMPVSTVSFLPSHSYVLELFAWRMPSFGLYLNGFMFRVNRHVFSLGFFIISFPACFSYLYSFNFIPCSGCSVAVPCSGCSKNCSLFISKMKSFNAFSRNLVLHNWYFWDWPLYASFVMLINNQTSFLEKFRTENKTWIKERFSEQCFAQVLFQDLN